MKKATLFTLLVLLSIVSHSQRLKKLIDTPFPEDIQQAVLYTPEGDTLNFSDVLKKCHGKVVYLEFWASWCGACRKEMQYAHDLSDKFADKDVIFLFISTDTKHEDWQKALDKNNICGEQYRIDIKSKPPVQKHFKIRGVPYFILINKNGTIANPKASWPRYPSAANEIRAILDK